MKSVWRKHLIILSALGLLAVPIYFLDLASTGGGGSSWITLDFRGFIFWAYVTWFAIYIVLSSIAVLSFPQSGLLRIHFGSMLLSLILLAAGFVVYGKLLRAFSMADFDDFHARQAARLSREKVTFYRPNDYDWWRQHGYRC